MSACGDGEETCRDGAGMRTNHAGMGQEWEDLLVAGWGWGRDCLPTSLSTLSLKSGHRFLNFLCGKIFLDKTMFD